MEIHCILFPEVFISSTNLVPNHSTFCAGHNSPSTKFQLLVEIIQNVVTVSCVERLKFVSFSHKSNQLLSDKKPIETCQNCQTFNHFSSYLLYTDNWPSNNILLTNLTNIVCSYQPRPCQS